MTSCGAVDSKKNTDKLIVAKPAGYTKQQQARAADELDLLDKNLNCKGCSILETMMINYKKLRDQNRIARNEKLP
jgi:hypothetical protein